MIRLHVAALALVVFGASSAFAQTTIVGDWDMTINSPQGANTTKVTFKQDGEKVDVLFKGPQGELPFTGTLTGSDLKFVFTIQFQGMPLEIAMTGKVENDAMTGKAKLDRETIDRHGRRRDDAAGHRDARARDDDRSIRDDDGWHCREVGRDAADAGRRVPRERDAQRGGGQGVGHVRQPDGRSGGRRHH